MRLKDKIGIVAAAASGIGRAGALRFAREGPSVVVVDLDSERARQVVGEIEADGGRAIALAGDLCDMTFAGRIVHVCSETFGGVDFLWAHAGAKVSSLKAYLEAHADVLKSPQRLEDVNVSDFDAVFVPGGHGLMQDLAVSASVGHVLTTMLANPEKMVGAVCHGQASFLSAGDSAGWAFKGRRLTGFTNTEETQVGLAENAPWLLEDRLRAAGASFEAGEPWSSHVRIRQNWQPRRKSSMS